MPIENDKITPKGGIDLTGNGVQWPGGGLGGNYETTIGNGTLTAFLITHNLGVEDVIVTLINNTTNQEEDCLVTLNSVNSLTLSATAWTTTPLTTNAYRVICSSPQGILTFNQSALAGQPNGLATLDSGAHLPLAQNTPTVNSLASPAVVLAGWTVGNGQYSFTSVTASSFSGVPTAGNVIWPDGATGVFTSTTINSTFGTPDAFTITYVPASGSTFSANHTVTQSLVTRNSYGVITNNPLPTVV